MTGLTVTTTSGGARFDARVTPRASRNAVEGVRDGRLLVRVTSPPVDAAANAAVIALLAETLGIAKRHVTLVGGERNRTKSFVISGLTESQLRLRLGHVSCS
jgi:uncharacterized protein (TIGR00251 family)